MFEVLSGLLGQWGTSIINKMYTFALNAYKPCEREALRAEWFPRCRQPQLQDLQ